MSSKTPIPHAARSEGGSEQGGTRDEHVARLQSEIKSLRQTQRRLNAVNESLSEQLDEILTSQGFRWLMRYRRMKQRAGRFGRWLPGGIPGPRRRPRASTPIAERTIALDPVPLAEPFTEPGPLWETLTVLPAVDLGSIHAVAGDVAADGTQRLPDIICFSIIDWEFRYQRPQQMMSQFAAHGHRVFYLSPSRFVAGGSEPAVRLVKDGVYEVQAAADRVPDVYGELMSASVANDILSSLALLRRTYDISAAVSYVMIASWTEIALEARSRWGWPVLYDCMDEWDTFPGIQPALIKAEANLVDDSDVVVVSAGRLAEKWRNAGRREPLILARNAVDFDYFAERCQPNDLLAATRHPIVGYYGAIAEWFDVDLAVHLAKARPSWQFVFIGGVFNVDVSALRALPNVSLLGQQPYSTMPEYLFHFDACIIPFKVNPVTEATDPVKMYEFLSAGKPVVSVALPEIEPAREHVYLAATEDEFVTQLDRAISERDPARVANRRAFAAGNTWADRYRAATAGLASVTELTSIVIVTHNNLPLTKLCVASLFRNTPHGSYELVLVDNGSSDATAGYLTQLAAQRSDVRVILNPANEGFPRANNQGLAASRGTTYLLLNNDTIVPPGWLPRLLAPLRDPEIGLVGPMTNFVGNEARLDVAYRTIGEMEHFALMRSRKYAGQIADIPMLAMFCTAMRRETFEATGPLDEQFGIGMFEDDDYTHRVRATGRRVVCAADAFVHHVGQAAFKKLIEDGAYNAIFDQNRACYERKWGVSWVPHRRGQLKWELHDQRGQVLN